MDPHKIGVDVVALKPVIKDGLGIALIAITQPVLYWVAV
jgi:hypothetical protein